MTDKCPFLSRFGNFGVKDPEQNVRNVERICLDDILVITGWVYLWIKWYK